MTILAFIREKLRPRPLEYYFNPIVTRTRANNVGIGELRVDCVKCQRLYPVDELVNGICIFCEKPELGGK